MNDENNIYYSHLSDNFVEELSERKRLILVWFFSNLHVGGKRKTQLTGRIGCAIVSQDEKHTAAIGAGRS